MTEQEVQQPKPKMSGALRWKKIFSDVAEHIDGVEGVKFPKHTHFLYFIHHEHYTDEKLSAQLKMSDYVLNYAYGAAEVMRSILEGTVKQDAGRTWTVSTFLSIVNSQNFAKTIGYPDDIFARLKILTDDWARIDTKKVAVFYYNGSCLPEKLTRKVFAQVCEQVICETAQILKEARNSYSDNTGPASDLVTPAFKDEGVNKLAKKDKHPSIHVSFFDTSIPVLEIVDDKGTGKAIVQHLLDKSIVSSLRYFDETGKVTKVINVTLS